MPNKNQCKTRSMTSEILNEEEANCALCADNDTIEMVSCDGCMRWFHFKCVGVNADIVDKEWLCSNCIASFKTLSRSNTQRQIELHGVEDQLRHDEIFRKFDELKTLMEKLSTPSTSKRANGTEIEPPTCDPVKTVSTNKSPTMKNFPSSCDQNQSTPRLPSALIKNTSLHDGEHQVEHFLARQTICRDLPSFSGSPEQWPTFISIYEYSTNACKFSDVENLCRLQKALKGDARKMVESYLTHPANVTSILQTLKMLYGRPAIIIQSQIDKLKKAPAPRADKLETLVHYAVQVRNLIAAIESAHVTEYLNDIRLHFELVERLPPHIRLDWGLYEAKNMDATAPKLRQFGNWLETIAQSACNVMTRSPMTTKFKDDDRVNIHANAKNQYECNSADSTYTKKCGICDKSCDSAIKCSKFTKLNLNDRWKVVNRLKLCRICLFHHKSPICKKVKKCEVNGCNKLHHQLLHNVTEKPVPSTANSSDTVLSATQRNASEGSILYRIIPITLKYDNVRVDTFAFIDDGSSLTLIEEKISTLLCAKGKERQLCMRWTDGQTHVEPNSKTCSLLIAPRNDQSTFYELFAQTISKLDLPIQSVNYDELTAKYNHLRQIDFDSYENAKPTMIIGLDNWHLCAPKDVREGNRFEPVATKTRLGWDLCGRLSSKMVNRLIHPLNVHKCECSDERLEQLVKQFYKLESIGICNKKEHLLTDEEKRAERIMKEKTFKKDGRYEVALLWKFDQFILPDSYGMAMKRLTCLERKLLGDEDLLNAFKAQIGEYTKKGFLRTISTSEFETSCTRIWYLPTFIVKNPNKPGKIRMVFDAAAKTDGISLNSMLLKGPDLMCPLLEILIRFRTHAFAVVGDIREMFHMIRVRNEDQMAQRILWRECDQTRAPDIYIMNDMTFGATCSPYQAQYVMQLNASKFLGQYNETVKSILRNTYVDDIIDGRETESDLVKFVEEMKIIHAAGGFEIRKFKSNAPQALERFHSLESQFESCNFTDDWTEKVLGIFWNVKDDCLTYSLRFNKANQDVLNGNRKPTKRQLLTTLMSIYDPLGLIAHFIAGLKFIQQDTWQFKIGWDEPIPDELNKRWMKWVKQLKEIESLKIPRRYVSVPWIGLDYETSLHTFVDAGEAAYAAAVFLRVVTPNGVEVSLVSAKVKAAPLKYVPIPRLELQAATIGARLFQTTFNALEVAIHYNYFWSDSSVVLSWINSQKKLPAWVACRVGEIRETTDINQWRWVSSRDNVADIPTKWRDTIDLSHNSHWLRGPKFLEMDEEFWPKCKDFNENETKYAEDKDPSFEFVALHRNTTCVIDAYRFSKWTKLLRTAAYVLRFVNLTKRATIKYTGSLKSDELRDAENLLFREAQKEYSAELVLLKRNSQIPKESRLYKLSPTLDSDNIIRLKSRVDNEFPIILPNLSRITYLIVMKEHEKCAHQFSETVVNELRKRFHIPRLRVLVNQVRNKCQMCKIILARPVPPEMAPMPSGRLTIGAAPFSHTGIDLFGPLFVNVRRRHEKRWVVIFTCLTIRAIHLEMVNDLSTDRFLMAFRNFVARRGQPLECYSDRGTNLVGAEKVIQNAYQEVDFAIVEEATTTPTLKWNFNPPLSPHMGGAWERLIRSVKSAMRVMLDKHRVPSPDVLQNVLIEIESLINSRPLTYVPLDHPNQEAITPNHALLAYKNPTKPLGVPTDVKAPKLHWRQSQQALQRFYRQWILTYRPTLTRRSKWFEVSRDLKVGDIVLIIDENDKTRKFPKGRIVDVTLSKDGHVRAATVQTSGGVYIRPTVMLAKLDVDGGSDGDPSRPGV